ALYSDEDIYLLDDPLSAVDSEVANHIFDKCICDYLKTKTVVLVTHQIQFIQKATKILVLKEGRSLAFGTYEELLDSGIDFMSLISDNKYNVKQDISNENTNEIVMVDKMAENTLAVQNEESEPKDQFIADEYRHKGSVEGKVYWHYIRAGGGPLLISVILFTTIIYYFLDTYIDIYLSIW
ncbi:unnamed protein product, partial [Oppiella nova]